MDSNIDWRPVLRDLAHIYHSLLTPGTRASCKTLWHLWSTGTGKWDHISYEIVCNMAPAYDKRILTSEDTFTWDRVPLLKIDRYNAYYAGRVNNCDEKCKLYNYYVHIYERNDKLTCYYEIYKYNSIDDIKIMCTPSAPCRRYYNIRSIHIPEYVYLITIEISCGDKQPLIIYNPRTTAPLFMSHYKLITVNEDVLASIWAYMITDRLDIKEYLETLGISFCLLNSVLLYTNTLHVCN